MKNKKAGIELVGGETTDILLKVFAFILIVTIFLVMIFAFAVGGPDATCKVFATANGLVPGNWIIVPKHFCQPKGLVINAIKDCDCLTFISEDDMIFKTNWTKENCTIAKEENDGVCNTTWQRKYIAMKIAELGQRCWQMGSAGKLNTGEFGCFMAKVYFDGEDITQEEIDEGYDLFINKVKVDVEGVSIIPYGLNGRDFHNRGRDKITSTDWVGILHCGGLKDGTWITIPGVIPYTTQRIQVYGQQRILYFSGTISSEIANYLSGGKGCP